MRLKTAFAAALAATTLGSGLVSPALGADVTMLRVFGDCANEYSGVTDLSKATGECGIIQVLTNKFNAENTIGARVITQTADWNTYYDLLSASYSTGNIPDLAVIHRSVLPNYANRGLVEPLGEELAKAGIDFNDFVPAAKEAVTFENQIYAVPFDIHALLVHINVDLMKQAGLVDGAGNPTLPKSADELIAQGKKFKEATGKNYITMEANSTAAMNVRLFDSLVWQQGSDIVASDNRKSTIDTAEGLKAAELLSTIYGDGLANKALDYAGSQQAFLGGDAGMEINGTWVVDDYTAQAASGRTGLKTYKVANLFDLYGKAATWADSHTWAIPTDANRSPDEKAAALTFLKFLYDNNYEWSRTGHLTSRQSVLDSDKFKALPHRSEYADTTKIAHALPPIQNQRAIQDVMLSELTAIWLADVEPKTALEQLQSRVDQTMRRARN